MLQKITSLQTFGLQILNDMKQLLTMNIADDHVKVNATQYVLPVACNAKYTVILT